MSTPAITLSASPLSDHSADSVLDWLVGELARELKKDRGTIDVTAPFESLGVTSLIGVALAANISDSLDLDIPATLFWDYPTLERLATYLSDTLAEVA